MKKIKIFILNSIVLLVSSLILQVIGMFFNVYISNKIGTESIGIYQLIMSVYMFSITVANSGIHLATTRIISEQQAFGMEEGIKKGEIVEANPNVIASGIFGFVCSSLIYKLRREENIHYIIRLRLRKLDLMKLMFF